MSSSFNFTERTTGLEVAQALGKYIRGRNVLITGPTIGGIGFEAAKAIATQQPGLLILAGRSKEKYEEAVTKIREVAPAVNIRTLDFDTSSVESAKAAAHEVLSYPEPLHILINNSGLAALPTLQFSVDGFELQTATNHVGAFVFTNLLIPKIKQSGPDCRIIMCASRAHRFAYGNLFPPIRAKEVTEYQKWYFYALSKCWNILYGVALSKRLKDTNIEVFTANGGHVMTNLLRHIPREEKESWGWRLTENGMPTPETSRINDMEFADVGSKAVILGAFDPSIKGQSGSYIDKVKVDNHGDIDGQVLNPENAEKMWKITLDLLGNKSEFDWV